MSIISARWTSVAVMVLVALPLQAHLGDRVIPIFEITDEQLELIDFEDGIIDEWEGFGEPSLTSLDFTGFSPYEDDLVPDPGDLDFRIWLGWNRTHNRLYGSIQAADDSYLEGREALILYIDGDHSGGKYHYFTDPQMNQQQAQSYVILVGSLEPDGPNIQLSQLSDQMECMWCNYSPYAGIGGRVLGENPAFWIVEFYVTPFDALVWDDSDASVVSTLDTGKTIGISVDVSDYDSDTDVKDWEYYVLNLEILERTADNFVDGLLVRKDGFVEDGSAVRSVSWAKIKASLNY